MPFRSAEVEYPSIVMTNLGSTIRSVRYRSALPLGLSKNLIKMFLAPIDEGCEEYQVDGEIFPVSEGTIVRVAPDGKRALKNTGKDNLTMLCIQYKANAFGEADSPMTDGVILQDELKW